MNNINNNGIMGVRVLFICLNLVFVSIISLGQNTSEKRGDSAFTLSYISVGFGSNMFTQQPMFRVTGTKFIYTFEDAWQFKNQEKSKPDTVCTGNIRTSTIDSILNITTEIKGDSVYKLNSSIRSGGAIYLDIKSSGRSLHFTLDNSFDSTAKRIVDVLNSYIPYKKRKLWVSNVVPYIIEIK